MLRASISVSLSFKSRNHVFQQFFQTGLKLFGQTYSGLEYDYRGLLHVYEELSDNFNYRKYSDILDEWRILRSDEKRVSCGRQQVVKE